MSLASIICYSRAIFRSPALLSTSIRSIDRLLFFRPVGCGARAVRGGLEQPWNVHPRKLDREIFEDGPSAKIGSLENFRPYGNTIIREIFVVKIFVLCKVTKIFMQKYFTCTKLYSTHLKVLLHENF